MNIYDYIRSKAVAEHCRKIGKVWNTCEMAIIIGRSDCSLDAKHRAWRELITDFPDMPVIPNIHQIKFDSIHGELERIIDFERLTWEDFTTPMPDAVYQYKVCGQDQYNYSSSIYSRYGGALKDAKDIGRREEAPKIMIKKSFIDDDNAEILAEFSYDGIFLSLNVYGSPKNIIYPASDTWRLFPFDDMFFVDIPAPFKRGDLLTVPGVSARDNEPYVFVLDSLDRDDPKHLASALRGENCDGSDMIGWGFYAGENGILYGDHTQAYDTFEYFAGKLEGNNRLLHYVSLFLGDKISLPAMLNAQCRIAAEYDLKNRYTNNGNISGAYIPEELLAENRQSEAVKNL